LGYYALKLIEDFGADGVRFGMMSCSPAGGDLLFDDKLCQQGKEFCNKMWNGLRLVKGWEVADKPVHKDLALVNELANQWFKSKLSETIQGIEKNFEQYQAIGFFEQLMTMLHPVMPFVTEEIWHKLKTRKKGDDCINSSYPKVGKIDKGLVKDFEVVKDIISKIRDIRQKNNLKSFEPLKVFVQNSASATTFFKRKGVKALIAKMGVLESLVFTDKEPENTVNFIAGTEKYYVELNLEIDEAAELERITKELDYNKGFLISVEKKLSNERFVNNQKQADAKAKIAILEESLAKLGGTKTTVKKETKATIKKDKSKKTKENTTSKRKNSIDKTTKSSKEMDGKKIMSLSRRAVIYAKTAEDRKKRLLEKNKPTLARL